MSYRFWLFLTGILGLLAIAAGSYGAHVLRSDGFSASVKNFETGVIYHGLHVMALFGVTAMLAITDGKRAALATWALQIAAFAFVAGIILFSGGLYAQTTGVIAVSPRIVPYGGLLLMIGWAALASSAFGLRRSS
ncbi:MAG: DUF423 domain-containing protein [Hyphomicrobiales bacterium]|nr:DUF423 domain-containing protein [Hyphomicrobiales bacterium]